MSDEFCYENGEMPRATHLEIKPFRTLDIFGTGDGLLVMGTYAISRGITGHQWRWNLAQAICQYNAGRDRVFRVIGA